MTVPVVCDESVPVDVVLTTTLTGLSEEVDFRAKTKVTILTQLAPSGDYFAPRLEPASTSKRASCAANISSANSENCWPPKGLRESSQ